MGRTNAWKGCAAGMVGGLAATVVMTGFQSLWNAVTPKLMNGHDNGRQPESAGHSGQNGKQRRDKQNSESENPTAKVADKIAGIAGEELSEEGKKTGGMVVHYAFGTVMGALYGAALEYAPRRLRQNAVGSGLLLGSGLFAAADEAALPALRLTEKPTEIPASMHAYGLVSHLVYGATAGLVTRTLRNAM